jgi:membrane-bound metal-dependent hydrolase YbcI (DUF457 family)
VALPLAHVLIGAACGEALRGPGMRRRYAWTAGGIAGIIPDMYSAWLLLAGQRAPMHGYYSHTILAMVLAGALVWILAGRRWGLLVGAAYGSHLLVDLLRESTRTSVYLWGPFSDRAATSLGAVFPSIPFELGLHRDPMLSLYGPAPLEKAITQTAIAAGVLAVAVIIRTLAEIRQRGHPSAARAPADFGKGRT